MPDSTKYNETIDFTEYDLFLDKCTNENEVQRYLEANGNLIPVSNWLLGHQVQWALIISKYKFGNQYISDFVYLTKCSDEWYVVFVEIENPKKTFSQRTIILHQILTMLMNKYRIGRGILKTVAIKPMF